MTRHYTAHPRGLRIKTQPGSGSLCSRCQYGWVRERERGQRWTTCDYARTETVPPDIVHCSEFLDKTQPTRHDLEKIAWVIRHDRSGAIKGFEPPKKRGVEE